MIQLNKIFNQSELGLASYANLQSGSLNTEAQIRELRNAGMSASQATNFASRYSVVTQFDDITETGESSFNVTVFKDNSGKKTIGDRPRFFWGSPI